MLNRLRISPERFESLKASYLLRARRLGDFEVSIKRCKIAPNGILITLDGIRTRDEADKLRGATFAVLEADRWQLPQDAYYISDLIGCDAHDESGNVVGKISSVIRGAQDILSVDSTLGEVLVPFVREWVGDVDMRQRRVVIRKFSELAEADEIPPDVGERGH
ncbi:MAG: 16S rRNA processing protein RimM [bacterium]|nr:16S rRNA processing protein RimM [bacterium]